MATIDTCNWCLHDWKNLRYKLWPCGNLLFFCKCKCTEVYLKFAVHDRTDIYESPSICAAVCNNKSRICTIWSCRIDLSGPLCPPWSIGRAFVFVVTRFIIKTKKERKKDTKETKMGNRKMKNIEKYEKRKQKDSSSIISDRDDKLCFGVSFRPWKIYIRGL